MPFHWSNVNRWQVDLEEESFPFIFSIIFRSETSDSYTFSSCIRNTHPGRSQILSLCQISPSSNEMHSLDRALHLFLCLEITICNFEKTGCSPSESPYDSSMSAFVFRGYSKLPSASTECFHPCSSLPSSPLFHSMSSTSNDQIGRFLSVFFFFISIKERKRYRHDHIHADD